MAELVSKKSGGKMRIDIYPNQQLGTERQCLELMQIGSIAMAKVSGAVIQNFAPNTRVLSMPYIFRNKEHAHQVFDGPIGKALLLGAEKYWLKGLGYYDAGRRCFYAKRPIRRPKDLSGLKIRVQESKTAMELVESLGGSPTPISWGELYTALQQGVVDGAENNLPSFYLSHHYEVCPFYSFTEHTAEPDLLFISTHAWKSLSKEEQGWLMESVKESIKFQRKLWEESENEAFEALKKAGVTMIYPDKDPFKSLTQHILEENSQDPEMARLITSIQNLGK